MFKGSSQLKQAGADQVNNPKIKITLRENDYDNQVGSSGNVMYWDGYRQDSIMIPNDLMVVSGSTHLAVTDQAGGLVKTFDSNGATLRFSFDLGGTLTNSTFLLVGETLEFYYINNRKEVHRRVSSTGLTWSGGETLYSTVNFIQDVAVAGSTRLYIAESTGASVLSTYDIRRLKDVGGWGVTTLLSAAINSLMATSHALNVVEIDNEDVLLYINNVGSSGSARGELNLLRTDGFNNVFERRNLASIYPMPNSPTEDANMYMSNLVKGATLYHVVIGADQQVPSGGIVGKATTLGFNQFVMSSKDMLHWSTQKYLPGVSQTNVSRRQCITAGVTHGFELLLHADNTGENYHWIMKSGNEIDVSDSIVSYNNNNNERISLTLQNLL